MGRKLKTCGLTKRGQIWHINKVVNGRRICESTGTNFYPEAEAYLARRLEQLRKAKVYGVRPDRTFREAAVKYIKENQHLADIKGEARQLKFLDSYIGNMLLKHIGMDALKPFIQYRLKQGVKRRTINRALQVVRQMVNLSATEWRDKYGLTWLHSPPKIKLLKLIDAREPNSISWEDQDTFFSNLAPHLRDMAIFKVNAGCRDNEVCSLRWEWEFQISQINAIVFFYS